MSYSAEEIEALVRQVVNRVIGEGQTAVSHTLSASKRPLIDAEYIQQIPPNTIFALPPDALITPLARQAALERHIHLEESSPSQPTPKTNQTVIAIGADHGGYTLKETLKKMLATTHPGHEVVDCGTHGMDSVDYPEFAYAVAQLVGTGRAWRGIIIDGAGIGSCMAANKVPGVLAAMCYDQATAVNSREHNNANVLTLGAGLIGPNLAQQIVKTWLATEFGGDRHARRVDKIWAIEKRFSK
ncbi:ribose 5-phosphate isomerase B [Candidatus Leptofilum sp.]|uniref:ribose 5-phosphate isomerase B n=1 Tax=Candidatus Leptofilum sp. TaxID=3241576 RepID=UPI003B5A79D2